MSTTFLEHRVALSLAPDPFNGNERKKALRLLKRLRDLQWRDRRGDASASSEGERAALLWALTELGVICGQVTQPRHGAADLRCVRPSEHGGLCDNYLGRDK